MAQKQRGTRTASAASTWKQQQELQALSVALLECCGENTTASFAAASTTSHATRQQLDANVQPRQLARRLAAVFEYLKQGELGTVSAHDHDWVRKEFAAGKDVHGRVMESDETEVGLRWHHFTIAAEALESIIADGQACTAFTKSFVQGCLFLAWMHGMGEEAGEGQGMEHRLAVPDTEAAQVGSSVPTMHSTSAVAAATPAVIVSSSTYTTSAPPAPITALAVSSATAPASLFLLSGVADDLAVSARWRLSSRTYGALLYLTHGTPSMLAMLALHRPVCSQGHFSSSLPGGVAMHPASPSIDPHTKVNGVPHVCGAGQDVQVDMLRKLFACEPRLVVPVTTCLAPAHLVSWAVSLARPTLAFLSHTLCSSSSSLESVHQPQPHGPLLQQPLLQLLFRGLDMCARLPIKQQTLMVPGCDRLLVKVVEAKVRHGEDTSQRLTCLLLLACCELELLQSISHDVSSPGQDPLHRAAAGSLLLECSSALESCACAWQSDVAGALLAGETDNAAGDTNNHNHMPGSTHQNSAGASHSPTTHSSCGKAKTAAENLISLLPPLQIALTALVQDHLSGVQTPATVALPFARAFQLNSRLSLLSAAASSASVRHTSAMQPAASATVSSTQSPTNTVTPSNRRPQPRVVSYVAEQPAEFLLSPFLHLIAPSRIPSASRNHNSMQVCASRIDPQDHRQPSTQHLQSCNPYAQTVCYESSSSSSTTTFGSTASPTTLQVRTDFPSASAAGNWRKVPQLDAARQAAMQQAPFKLTGVTSSGLNAGLACAVMSAISTAAVSSQQAGGSLEATIPSSTSAGNSWRQTVATKAATITAPPGGTATAAATAAATAHVRTAVAEVTASAKDPNKVLQDQLSGFVAAILTSNMNSLEVFPAFSSQLMQEQGGTDIYSHFRTAVLLLEVMDAVSTIKHDSSVSDQHNTLHSLHDRNPSLAARQVTTEEAGLSDNQSTGVQGSAAANECHDRSVLLCASELSPLLLRMAVGALQKVASPVEQRLLQRLMICSPRLSRTLAAQQASPAFAAAATQALVPITNRLTRQQTSLESSGTALGPAAESARLSAASCELLPFALLQPAVLLHRLIAISVASRDQHPMVVQLLQSFKGCLALDRSSRSEGASSLSYMRHFGASGMDGSGSRESTSVGSVCGSVMVEALGSALRPGACVVQGDSERGNFLALLRVLLGAGLVEKVELLQDLVLDLGSRFLGIDPTHEAAPANPGGTADYQAMKVRGVCRSAMWQCLQDIQQQQQQQWGVTAATSRVTSGFNNTQLQLLCTLLEVAAVALDHSAGAGQSAKFQTTCGEGVPGLLLLLVAMCEELCELWRGRQVLLVRSLELALGLLELLAARCTAAVQHHTSTHTRTPNPLQHTPDDASLTTHSAQQRPLILWWHQDVNAIVALLPHLQRRSVMTLLPLLDAACRLHDDSCVNTDQECRTLLSHATLSKAVQPTCIWRPQRTPAINGAHSTATQLQQQLLELLSFCMVADTHTTLVLAQLRAAAEAWDEEDQGSDDERSTSRCHPTRSRAASRPPWEVLSDPGTAVCATAKHAAGYMIRQLLQSQHRASGEVALSALASALAELLLTARADEATRLLVRLLPRLAAVLCGSTAHSWWGAASTSFGAVIIANCGGVISDGGSVYVHADHASSETAPGTRVSFSAAQPAGDAAPTELRAGPDVCTSSADPATSTELVCLGSEDNCSSLLLAELSIPQPAAWSALVVHLSCEALSLHLDPKAGVSFGLSPLCVPAAAAAAVSAGRTHPPQTVVDRMSRFLSIAITAAASAVDACMVLGSGRGDAARVQQLYGKTLVAWGVMRELVAITAAVAAAGMDVSCLQALLLMQMEALCHQASLTVDATTAAVLWATLQPEIARLVQPLPHDMTQMIMVAAHQLCCE